MFLTITSFFDIETLPFARHVVTIIGSITGVRPTAIDTANKNALGQLCFVIPLSMKTTGTMNAMNFISIPDTDLIPRSKLVSACGAVRYFAV